MSKTLEEAAKKVDALSTRFDSIVARRDAVDEESSSFQKGYQAGREGRKPNPPDDTGDEKNYMAGYHSGKNSR